MAKLIFGKIYNGKILQIKLLCKKYKKQGGNVTMKKAYISPRLDKVMMEDVIMMSTPALNLGGGDWGVEDVL